MFTTENGVRPAPTGSLAYRYASAWFIRPEAVVRVAPRFWQAIAFDVVGITAGIIAFVALIIGLAHL